MSRLRERMAEHGFESNASYEFEVDCLLRGECGGVRTLNVQGDSGRHKTSFANALAHALDYSVIRYLDFSHSQQEEDKEIEREIMQLGEQPEGKFVPPVKPLDKIMSDACAHSESESTFAILDQLQLAQFQDHIRLNRFVHEGIWGIDGSQYTANPKRLLLCLISEEPLYHSLMQQSYRIWVYRHALRNMSYTAEELEIPEAANPLVQGLNELFTEIGLMPTIGEFKLLMADLLSFVRHEDQFASAIYARVSAINKADLITAAMVRHFRRLMPLLEKAINIEHIDT